MTPAKDESSQLSRTLSNFVGYGTIAATLLMLLFFLIIPVCVMVGKAFLNNGEFTLEYFRLLFANELQMESIWNSLYIGVATTIVCTAVTLPLSIINAKFDYRGKTLLSGLLLVPMVMPPFVGAIGIMRFFARRGSVNLWLMDNGWITEPINWLGESNMFWAVVILEVLHLYPIMYLNLTAALANIDPSLEEMATTMGVPRWKQYVDIVWPLARPGYFAGAIIVFIWALTDLGTPLLVGFEHTMPVRIFNMITDVNANPVGFALVFIVIVLTVGFFLASKLLFTGKKYEMMAKGHVTSSVRKVKSWGHIPIYAIMGTIIFAAFIPHISVAITSFSDKWFMTVMPEQWTLKYYTALMETELAANGIQNSFLLAGLSTLLDLVLGLLVAYVVVENSFLLLGFSIAFV